MPFISHRIHRSFVSAVFAGGLLFFGGAACNDHHHHQDGAHVHGVAQLDIALENSREIGFEFRAPAETIYGFEYEAKSDADKNVQAAALARLEQDFASLAGLPAGANCAASEIDVHVEAPGDEQSDGDHDHSHDHGHDHGEKNDEHSEDSGHREVHVTAVFKCAGDVAGTRLAPRMFDDFQNLQSLQIQLIGASEQRSATLSRDGKRSLAL